MGQSALSLAVSSAVIVVLGLLSAPGRAELLSLVVGLWVGFFLAWGRSDFSVGVDGRQGPFTCGGSSARCLCWSCCLP